MSLDIYNQFLNTVRINNPEFYKSVDFDNESLYNMTEEELLRLTELYSLDISETTIRFYLDNVSLYYNGTNYLLGDYTFKIYSDGSLSCNSFKYNYDILHRKDPYKHIYISGSTCCLGTYVPVINKSLFFGNLSELFIIIRTWLSYDSDSGFISIEEFLFNNYCPVCGRKLIENDRDDIYCPNHCKFENIDLSSLSSHIQTCYKCGEELNEDGECYSCSRCYKCGELLNEDECCPDCDYCYECNRRLDEEGYCPSCDYCGECDSLLEDDICHHCQRCEECNELLNDSGHCDDCDYCSECGTLLDDKEYCPECDYCEFCEELKEDCCCTEEEINKRNEFIVDYGVDDGSQLQLFDEQLKLKLTL